MGKPIHVKPSLYAFYFLALKEIALKFGYNLVLHGSMNRDLDLIAIPWQEEIMPYPPMIEEMANKLGGYIMDESEERRKQFADKYHGREVYIINLNRGKAFSADEDPQYYIDISVIPIPVKTS